MRIRRKGDTHTAEKKDILDHGRIRKIAGLFAWLDHRFITGGFLDDLATIEIVLYFFLVVVSDRYGLSFYHDDRICRILKIDLSSLGQAREGLIQRSLIAYRYPVYQVLALQCTLVVPPTKEERKDILSVKPSTSLGHLGVISRYCCQDKALKVFNRANEP